MGAPEGFQVQAFQQAYYSFQGHPQAPEAPASFQVAMSQVRRAASRALAPARADTRGAPS